MFDVLTRFIQELREGGVPVSMVEAIDAMEAIRHTDIADRSAFKAALGATLVKNIRHYEAFDIAFEVFFALDRSHTSAMSEVADEPTSEAGERTAGEGGQRGSGGGNDAADELMRALMAALAANDPDQLRRVAKASVEQLAGMERGRPVGGTYYLYRTLRQLSVDEVLSQLVGAAREEAADSLDLRLRQEELEERLERFARGGTGRDSASSCC